MRDWKINVQLGKKTPVRKQYVTCFTHKDNVRDHKQKHKLMVRKAKKSLEKPSDSQIKMLAQSKKSALTHKGKEQHNEEVSHCLKFLQSFLTHEEREIQRPKTKEERILLHASQTADYQTVLKMIRLRTRLNIADKHGLNPLTLCLLSEDNIKCDIHRMLYGRSRNTADFKMYKGEVDQTILALFDTMEGQSWTGLFASKSLINIQNLKGKTLLHVAAAHKRNSTLSHLLSLGGDVNLMDEKGYTPLFLSVSINNAEGMRLLVRQGAEIDRVRDRKELDLNCYINIRVPYTPLCLETDRNTLDLICRNKRITLLELLVAEGVDINKCYRSISISKSDHISMLGFILFHEFYIALPFLLSNALVVNKPINNSGLLALTHVCTLYSRNTSRHYKTVCLSLFCTLISAGGNMELVPKQSRNYLQYNLFHDKDLKLMIFLHKSGYQFVNLTQLYHCSGIPAEVAAEVRKPCTLQSLCCNTIRVHLYPNAWVCVRHLPLPVSIQRLIVLNSNIAQYTI